MANFEAKNSLYYKTSMQRYEDIKNKMKIDITKINKKIKREDYEKYWVARVAQMLGKEEVWIKRPKEEKRPQEERNRTYLREVREKLGHTGGQGENGGLDLSEVTVRGLAKEWEEIPKEIRKKLQKKEEWGRIKREICIGGGIVLRREIRDMIEGKRIKGSHYEEDKEREVIIQEEEGWGERKEVEIYTDGSEIKGKAGFGVWSEGDMGLVTAYRVLGEQSSYNAELQGVIFGVTNAPPKTICNICVDNEAVVKLGKRLKGDERVELKQVPQPHLTRLLKDRLDWKENIEQTTINFVKVKGHTGIKGNEEADEAARVGTELNFSYLEPRDLVEFQNDWVLVSDDKEILSNYRKELKKKHQKETKIKATEDRNSMWKRMVNTKCIREVSNSLTRDKKVKKQVVNMILKARADLLPHAAQLVERDCENMKSPFCPWCSGKVENTEHILIECHKYEEIRMNIGKEVWEIIRGDNKMNDIKQMKNTIPEWFCRSEKGGTMLYQELEEFDKLAGMLGYIPRELEKVIRDYKDNGKKKEEQTKNERRKEDMKIRNILKRIHRKIIKGAHKIWLRRNEEWKKKGEDTK